MSLSGLRDRAEDEGGDVVAPAPAKRERATPSLVPNMYCLRTSHDPQLLTDNRMFYWDPDDKTCPVCPVCNRQVEAQYVDYDAKGRPQIPANLRALASRLGEVV